MFARLSCLLRSLAFLEATFFFRGSPFKKKKKENSYQCTFLINSFQKNRHLAVKHLSSVLLPNPLKQLPSVDSNLSCSDKSVCARACVCASYWKLMWCQWGVFKGRITFLHPSAATQRCDLHHHRCLRCWTPLQSVAHSQTDNVTRAVLPASLHFRGNILNFVLTLTALNGSNFTMLRSFRFHLRKSHVNHIHPVLWNPDDCSPRSVTTPPSRCLFWPRHHSVGLVFPLLHTVEAKNKPPFTTGRLTEGTEG